ncbi:MAG: 3-deoxy-7-phosphoheptulonate synthase [Deltaproteobacteria bacterium]|nr:MAG: 3-deoxy-7-phosphoheptulonate synthase [Deltaproteobacteria bacterium]
MRLRPGADAARVRRALSRLGQWVRECRDERGVRTFTIELGAPVSREQLLALEGVSEVSLPSSPHPKVDAMPRRVEAGPVTVGVACPPVVMAGPCAVETEAQVGAIAKVVARHGARLLRGGAYKPRTSPYSFRGHGEKALLWLARAARACGLGVVTECLAPEDAELVAHYADLVQIGTRNMQNFRLLEAVGRTGAAVLLKRGMSATLEEWLLAGEYLLDHGARGVIFCERGIRHFDPSTRNLLDLSAVAVLAHEHHLPVIADPSHGAGRRDLILPLSRAALAAGACGLLVEVHVDPGVARSDGPQALDAPAFESLMQAVREEAGRGGRQMAGGVR